jgi:uncharacterized protein (TIGR00730 family)
MQQRKSENLEYTLKTAQNVISSDDKDLRSLLYKHLISNSLRCKEDELDILDLKVISRAVSEFRYAACIFKPYRNIRKVSIFGSARIAEGNPNYQLAFDLGYSLAKAGYMVITGASDGIMKAGIEGAGVKNSFGVNILLPFEKGPARIIRDDPKVMRFKYFFTRKIFFVMEADAIALFPGGFGTHDEGFEVLTLLQTGKTPPMPVMLMEPPGENYWETWDTFVKKELLDRGYISPEDLSFYDIVHFTQEAATRISSFYSTYHSIRQVRDNLVIRLNKDLSDSDITKLNESYKDLIKTGKIIRTKALPEEHDEPAILSNPRIALNYNKKSAGRLNMMILEINRLGKQKY